MRLVGESFAWPFRGRSRWIWPIGIAAVSLLPVLFIPVLGYAIAATRAAEENPSLGPPRWTGSARLVTDGLWCSLAVLVSAIPFALLWDPLSRLLEANFGALGAHVLALLVLALPWGLLALLIFPHATAAFAATGRPRDLFDVGAALHAIRGDLATWNIAVAAIVTAWAVAVACIGLLCVGLVPGIFYAILVSAHAAAALRRPGPCPSAG